MEILVGISRALLYVSERHLCGGTFCYNCIKQLRYYLIYLSFAQCWSMKGDSLPSKVRSLFLHTAPCSFFETFASPQNTLWRQNPYKGRIPKNNSVADTFLLNRHKPIDCFVVGFRNILLKGGQHVRYPGYEKQ